MKWISSLYLFEYNSDVKRKEQILKRSNYCFFMLMHECDAKYLTYRLTNSECHNQKLSDLRAEWRWTVHAVPLLIPSRQRED